MKLASEALRDGALARAQKLLSRHQPRNDQDASSAFEWRYLQHSVRERAATRTLTGVSVPSWHSGTLVCVGETLYNVGDDKIRAWDLTNWAQLPLAPPSAAGSVHWWWHPRQEIALAVDPTNHTLTVYDLPNFKRGSVVQLRLAPIWAAISPDRRMLAVKVQDTHAQRIVVWDLIQNIERGVIGEQTDKDTQMLFSPDSTVLALAYQNGAVGLWDAHTVAPLPSPPKVQDEGRPEITFSPIGHRLAIANTLEHDRVMAWDWVTRESFLFRYPGSGFNEPFAFSPNGKLLVTASIDDSLVLLDARTMQQIGTLRGHHAAITALAFSSDGNLLASGSMAACAKLWDLSSQREIATMGGHGYNLIGDLSFLPDGQTVATLSSGGEVKVWDLPNMLKGNALLTNLMGGFRFAISPDGRSVAAQDFEQGKNKVRIWDRFTRREIHSIPTSQSAVGDLAFAPNGSALAWVTAKTLEIFDLHSGRHEPMPLGDDYSSFKPIAFSPDSQEIAFSSHTNLMLCELKSRQLRPFTSCGQEIDALAYSRDGTLLAVGLDNGAISLWDRRSGRKLSEAQAHMSITACVTFSKDGKWLASCGTLTIKLWRVTRNGLEDYRTLEGHAGFIPAVAFSPDGKRLVSASSDKTLKLWDTADGIEVGTLDGHSAWIGDVEFSRDGNTIFSIGVDGTLRTWEAPPLDKLYARAAPASTR